MLAIDDNARGFVMDFATRARQRGARERHVVHPQALEIIVLVEFDVVGLQHFAVRAQVNALVVDNDAVKVEEDLVDHPVLMCQTRKLCHPAVVDFTEPPPASTNRSFCWANKRGRRSLSSTSKRRSTSASASSFFRLTW